MNNFSSITNSPTVSTTNDAVHFLIEKAGTADMTRFYIYVGVGIIATFLVQRLAVWGVHRFLSKSDPDIVNRVASALRVPLGLLTFSYFFIIGFDAIKGMPHELWMHVHEDLYPILNGLLLLICSFRLVDIIAHILRKRWEGESVTLDERWADLIGLAGKIVVSFGAGLFIIQKIDPSFNIIPILTGASFVGAAVALASQKTIANAIGSMEIMIDRLFKEGDRISFAEYDGFVVRMGLRSITLAALTGEKINLPNKDLVDKQIRNYTRGKFNRTMISVSVLYSCTRADMESALALMEATAKAHPRVDQCEAGVRRFGDSSMELQLIFWADYKTAEDYNRIVSEMHLALKEGFDKAGVSFVFPAQTVPVKKRARREEVTSPLRLQHSTLAEVAHIAGQRSPDHIDHEFEQADFPAIIDAGKQGGQRLVLTLEFVLELARDIFQRFVNVVGTNIGLADAKAVFEKGKAGTLRTDLLGEALPLIAKALQKQLGHGLRRNDLRTLGVDMAFPNTG